MPAVWSGQSRRSTPEPVGPGDPERRLLDRAVHDHLRLVAEAHPRARDGRSQPCAGDPTTSSTNRCLATSWASYGVPSQLHERHRPASKWWQRARSRGMTAQATGPGRAWDPVPVWSGIPKVPRFTCERVCQDYGRVTARTGVAHLGWCDGPWRGGVQAMSRSSVATVDRGALKLISCLVAVAAWPSPWWRWCRVGPAFAGGGNNGTVGSPSSATWTTHRTTRTWAAPSTSSGTTSTPARTRRQ